MEFLNYLDVIDVSQLTKSQIRQMGLEALAKALAPDGMAQFMQQFDLGSDLYAR